MEVNVYKKLEKNKNIPKDRLLAADSEPIAWGHDRCATAQRARPNYVTSDSKTSRQGTQPNALYKNSGDFQVICTPLQYLQISDTEWCI